MQSALDHRQVDDRVDRTDPVRRLRVLSLVVDEGDDDEEYL